MPWLMNSFYPLPSAQVFPTHARNFGSAVADGFGRIGGFASPFAVGECWATAWG